MTDTVPDIPQETDFKSVIEALLFASEDALPVGRISQLLDGALSPQEIRRMIAELGQEYEEQGRAFRIEEIAEGFQILTAQEFHPFITRLQVARQRRRLSEAALVTLSIIAYKQPISRAEIEVIRGVQSGQIVRALMDMKLVKIIGRANIPGRPMLYGTTRFFLDFFGLKSIKELPNAQELRITEGEST